MDIVVWVKHASKGKNDYWIVFDAYARCFDVNKTYKIEYCGTELNTSIPFIDGDKEKLRRMFEEDYSYGPFDIVKVNKKVGQGKRYIIEV